MFFGSIGFSCRATWPIVDIELKCRAMMRRTVERKILSGMVP
jgi:hypothetical protein